MDNVITNELEGKDPRVLEAKELVLAASAILAKLGPEMERVSWMLEDTVMYIDEALIENKVVAKDLSFLDRLEEDKLEEPEQVVR